STTLLTDPQILTDLSVGEGQDMFSEGNVETTIRLFEMRHKCNHFCEWPAFGLKKYGASTQWGWLPREMDMSAATGIQEHWVVICGDHPAIYSACPTFHCGRSSPPVPIAIQCWLLDEARQVINQLQPMLDQAPCNPATCDLLALFCQSEKVQAMQSALCLLGSYTYPLWKEVPMFWEALAYMIAKGVEEILEPLADIPDHVVEESTGPAASSLAAMSNQPALHASTSPARPGAPPASQLIRMTQCISIAAHHPQDSGNGKSCGVHVCTIPAYLDDCQMQEPAGLISPSPMIHTHVWNFHGVVESHYYPSDAEPIAIPFFNELGEYAWKYLVAHGYIEGAMAIVVEAHHNSHTAQDFAFTLARHGLPIAEGLFLWDLLN
ncbi:hypothetical protein SCLCIDRAFT_90261, partial [Scleroderma citrinum Foug A]